LQKERREIANPKEKKRKKKDVRRRGEDFRPWGGEEGSPGNSQENDRRDLTNGNQSLVFATDGKASHRGAKEGGPTLNVGEKVA